jgi:hypothetical protein
MDITKHNPSVVSKVSKNFVVLLVEMLKYFFLESTRAHSVNVFFPVFFLCSVNFVVCEIIDLTE